MAHAEASERHGKKSRHRLLIMATAVCISVVGLSNIIKYGYGYCGYIGIVMLVILFLTVGVYKNRKYLKNHNIPEA